VSKEDHVLHFAQVCVDALSLGSLYALAALGVGLLFGVMRLINFAHGDFITVGAYSLIVPSTSAAATLLLGCWPWPLMVLAVTAVVVALALVSERLAFRPLRSASPETLLIASFALSFLIEYLLLFFYGSRPKAIDVGSVLNQQIDIGGLRVAGLDLVTIALTIFLMGGLALFLKHTRFGIQMRASTEDFRMIRLLGVRADRVIALAFAISGILAAAVSLVLIARTGVLFPRMSIQLVMIAFVATVVGGMGSLAGAAVGGYFLGAVGVGMQEFLPEAVRSSRDAFVFGLVILVLLLRPQGLLPTRSLKERP
jgi:branched-chain amino acid transport system permease protein